MRSRVLMGFGDNSLRSALVLKIGWLLSGMAAPTRGCAVLMPCLILLLRLRDRMELARLNVYEGKAATSMGMISGARGEE